MKFTIEDTGEGWFWQVPSVEAEVATEMQVHSRRFYRLVFAEPLQPEETGPPGPFGGPPATYTGAWLSPRWVGHEIGAGAPTAALLWLLDEQHLEDEPDTESPFSARVACRRVE